MAFFSKVQVEKSNPTSPFPTSAEPYNCDKFGSCVPVPNDGPYQPEGPCDQCFCQCDIIGKYEEVCCQQGLVFNPYINHCDWPSNNDECM